MQQVEEFGSSSPDGKRPVSVAMQPSDGKVRLAYGPATRALQAQSVFAFTGLMLALAVAISEYVGNVPQILFAKDNGPHPYSVLSIALFCAAIYRPGPFKVQTLWRRASFGLIFGMSLFRLTEIWVFPRPYMSDLTMHLYRGDVVNTLSMGGNTALALLLLSLGALTRPLSSTLAFLITVLGLIPVSYALFSYGFAFSEGYGALSPIVLLILCLGGTAQFLVFARIPLLRPFLSETPWGRMARRQLLAATVGVLILGFMFHTRYEMGISGALLSAVFWMSVVILLAAGPMFERIERDRRYLSREMEKQARHDPLTGLPNRRAVRDFVANCQKNSGNAKLGCDWVGIILADVDYFKRVNDGAGHAVGDAVLRDVGEKLRRKLRPSDMVARWGGEEFLIILPGADLARTMNMAQVLRTGVAAHVSWHNGEEREAVTLSLGVAVYEHGGEETLEQAIQKADGALYDAKSQGRNRVFCADPALTTSEEMTPQDILPKRSMVH